MKWLLLLAALWSPVAFAWPVDWVHDVEVNREKFLRLPPVDLIDVEDPSIAEVKYLDDTNELLMVGLKVGRTQVLLRSNGRIAVWRIRVGQKPVTDAKLWAAAEKACPDFHPTPLEDTKLTVTVQNDACRKALLALFQTDAFEARFIELTFDGAVLQLQLKALQDELKKRFAGKVSSRYVGAGLVLEGTVSAREHRQVLWAVLKINLGRYAVSDEIEETPEPAPIDAGSKPVK